VNSRTNERAKDSDVFRAAVRVAQQVAKATRQKTATTHGTWTTEADESQARLSTYDKALALDAPEIARKAQDALRELRKGEDAEHASIIRTRSDVDHRRKDIAASAAGDAWALEHRETRDEIGPFTLHHRADSTVVKLGHVKLGELRFPTGEEVVRAVRAERARLEAAARALWPELRDRLVPLQQGDSEDIVPWARAVEVLSTNDAPFKKREGVVLFLLATLRAYGIDGWRVSFRPPSLAQQNAREAVSVPRIDKPGHADRVSGLRLEAPGAAAHSG
jgi:hypothetical protein